MLELIGSVVLGYYRILGMVLLICLVLGFLDDFSCANRRKRATRTGHVTQADREVEHGLSGKIKQSGPRPDNVVRFNRGK
jgi:hypothetical protein